jgi:hypothetical protein
MRNRHLRALGGAVVVVALALTACGGGKKDADASPFGSSPDPTCTGTAIADTGLPADFPLPTGVTLVQSIAAGPSKILKGYVKSDVDTMYKEWKGLVGKANYTILFSENEAPGDAEINYKSADGTSSGQIALRNICGGGDTIGVNITSRPE